MLNIRRNKAKRIMDATLGFDFQQAWAFRSVAVLAGFTILLVRMVWPTLWHRKQVVVSPVFGLLLRRVHQLRTSGFANRPSLPDILKPRAQLVAGVRARIRAEKAFFSRRSTD